MAKWSKLLIMTKLILCASNLNATIIEAKSMRVVQNKVEELRSQYAPNNTLIAFDIDMTLTQPDHPAVYYPTIYKYADVYKKIMNDLTPAQKDLASTLTILLKQKLVEGITPDIVKKLQKQDYKTIAFTASLTGSIVDNSDKALKIEQVRFESLKKFNLDFSKTFDNKEIIFTDMPPHNGNYPVFYNGILLANGEKGTESKGATLIAFLKHVKLSPQIIVMVYDKKKNLENIEHFLLQHDPEIKFLGIEYKGAFDYVPQDISKDEFEKFWLDIADKARSLA
jgi:hypothetical protein